MIGVGHGAGTCIHKALPLVLAHPCGVRVVCEPSGHIMPMERWSRQSPVCGSEAWQAVERGEAHDIGLARGFRLAAGNMGIEHALRLNEWSAFGSAEADDCN